MDKEKDEKEIEKLKESKEEKEEEKEIDYVIKENYSKDADQIKELAKGAKLSQQQLDGLLDGLDNITAKRNEEIKNKYKDDLSEILHNKDKIGDENLISGISQLPGGVEFLKKHINTSLDNMRNTGGIDVSSIASAGAPTLTLEQARKEISGIVNKKDPNGIDDLMVTDVKYKKFAFSKIEELNDKYKKQHGKDIPTEKFNQMKGK